MLCGDTTCSILASSTKGAMQKQASCKTSSALTKTTSYIGPRRKKSITYISIAVILDAPVLRVRVIPRHSASIHAFVFWEVLMHLRGDKAVRISGEPRNRSLDALCFRQFITESGRHYIHMAVGRSQQSIPVPSCKIKLACRPGAKQPLTQLSSRRALEHLCLQSLRRRLANQHAIRRLKQHRNSKIVLLLVVYRYRYPGTRKIDGTLRHARTHALPCER
jgi:hypothetical protein